MQYYKKHVYTSKNLRELIKLYTRDGFILKDNVDNKTYLTKKNHGSLTIHVLLLIATSWFSLGLINIIYLIISYFYYSKGIIIIYSNNNTNINNNPIFELYEGFDDLDVITNFLDTSVDDYENFINNNDKSPIISFLNHKK